VSFPRCRAGTKTDHPCENEASVDPFGTGDYFVCEQHHRYQELSNEQMEWNIARDYVTGFAEIAKVVDLDALNSAIDLAWAECEMRLSVLEAERRRVWE
jgi:hypothetical protein